MAFRRVRCPDCHCRHLEIPERTNFDGSPAPAYDEERVCTNCGAWLWVVDGDAMPAAPRLLTLSAVQKSEKLEAVLAGIAATEAFRHEFQRVSRAAWPSATVKRFS